MSDKVRNELLAIQRASKDKMLHAATVVGWARRNRKSALHRQFEWNNTKAANEYRIWQARRLIQLTIVSDDGGPQLVSLSLDRISGGGYRDVGDVVSNRKLSEIMLHDALAELQRVQARFARVKELTSVWKAVKRVQSKHAGKVRQMAKAA